MADQTRYLSVCSGIEAATQAWHPLGWHPVAFSEIEKFPAAVLAHHYPNVPNWGDMTRFKEWPDEPIDLLVGGTPCQDYSIAGLRAGMAGSRGALTRTFVEVAERYKPRWIVWENVPGVFSSNGGRDFAAFLCDLGACGYGWAYRVLDAQHVRTRRFPRAVPQRRRRVFVVGYLGDWRRAAAVLFDAESLRGNPPPRRKAGENVAATLAASLGGCSGKDDPDGRVIPQGFGGGNTSGPIDAAACLTAKGQRIDFEVETFVAHALRGEGFDASEDGTGRGTPIVPVAIQERAVSENPDAGPDGAGFRQDGAAYTLEARTTPQAVAFDCLAAGNTGLSIGDVPGTLHGGGKSGGRAAVAYGLTTEQTPKVNADCALTLTKQSPTGGGQVQAVAFDLRGREGGAMPEGPHETACIRASSGGSSRSYVAQPWVVRRLTPRECERLQGFPDDFTLIPYRRGMSADGPRYKSLGNSMAVNVMEWIGTRIQHVEALTVHDTDQTIKRPPVRKRAGR